MAKRKAKKPQQEDTSILLDSVVPQPKRRINSHASSALLSIIIFTVGASIMGWFCVQQQHSLDQLSESCAAIEKKITHLQQVMEMTEEPTDPDVGVEERIVALEEAQKQAQERAEVALATEKLKNSDLHSQLLALHDQMHSRLAEMNQVTLSVTILQAMFKNQSEEFEAVKESVAAGLSSSSALAENVASLTNAVARAYSRADKHVASVEALNAQLEGQASELSDLKESMHLHNVALDTIDQETDAIKELVEATQAMRAQALEEMLSSVQMTLDEQFFTSQTLHSSVMAQLQTFYTQLANAPSMSMKRMSHEEGSAAEELISTAAENGSEVQEELEEDEEKAVQEELEDEAEEAVQEDLVDEEKEVAKEEEEQPQEQEAEKGAREEDEEEEITEEEEEIASEEQEDEKITGQSESEEQEVTDETAEETLANDDLDESFEEEVSEEDKEITGHSESEEQEVTDETAEEEITEETVDSDELDKSLGEEVSEEAVESLETVEEPESAELISEIMDGGEEDE